MGAGAIWNAYGNFRGKFCHRGSRALLIYRRALESGAKEPPDLADYGCKKRAECQRGYQICRGDSVGNEQFAGCETGNTGIFGRAISIAQPVPVSLAQHFSLAGAVPLAQPLAHLNFKAGGNFPPAFLRAAKQSIFSILLHCPARLLML